MSICFTGLNVLDEASCCVAGNFHQFHLLLSLAMIFNLNDYVEDMATFTENLFQQVHVFKGRWGLAKFCPAKDFSSWCCMFCWWFDSFFSPLPFQVSSAGWCIWLVQWLVVVFLTLALMTMTRWTANWSAGKDRHQLVSGNTLPHLVDNFLTTSIAHNRLLAVNAHVWHCGPKVETMIIKDSDDMLYQEHMKGSWLYIIYTFICPLITS